MPDDGPSFAVRPTESSTAGGVGAIIAFLVGGKLAASSGGLNAL